MSLKEIQQWKIRQNMVLTIFLNVYIETPFEERKMFPVKLKTGERNYIVDHDGNELCEYSLTDGVGFVHWFRTFDDYELIDRLGRDEEDRAETAGGDESIGDDGRIAVEEGV